MPDKKLTDAEITVKALECCSKLGGCQLCEFYNEKMITCIPKVTGYALYLINRLQEENSNLTAENERSKVEAYKELTEYVLKYFNPDVSYDIRNYINKFLKEKVGDSID